MTTKPTDAEIADMARKAGLLPDNSHPAPETRATRRQTDAVQAFARAVLQRWGQPSGAGEVVVTKTATGQIVAVTRQDEEGRILSVIAESAPQPTQSVPPAGREPLTHEQITAAAKKLAECMEYPWEFMPEPGRANMRELARAVIEAARALVAPPTA